MESSGPSVGQPVEPLPDAPPETVTETVAPVDSPPATLTLDQGQMDMILAGFLVTAFLLAAILFAQLRRP